MKLVKIIGHPVLVMSLFSLVIIEGEHFGGFYILYLFFGLTYFAPFAIAGLVGIATLIIGNNLSSERRLIKSYLYLVGWLLLMASYLVFFQNSKNNHRETFETTGPIVSFVLFAISSICFLVNTVRLFIKANGKQPKTLVI